MANVSLSSVFAPSTSKAKRPTSASKTVPTGTFEATLVGIVDETFLCKQTGAPVTYKKVQFKVGKVIHGVSLSRLYFPNAPVGSSPRERLAAILEAQHTVDVTMTSIEHDRDRGIRAGYTVVQR